MVDLAVRERFKEGQELCANDIAEHHNLPASYTAKILGQLARAGLLRSDRGRHGGYTLARAPESITLLEVLQAVGAVNGTGLSLPDQVPGAVQSHLDRVLDRTTSHVHGEFSAVTLSDLMEGATPNDKGEGDDSENGPVQTSRMTNLGVA
jgi:Rrf2 family protein